MTRTLGLIRGAALVTLGGVVVALSLVLSVVVARAQAPSAQPSLSTQLQQALAQRTDKLAECNDDRGRMGHQMARIEAGELATVVQFKMMVEKANPGQTINDQFKIVPVATPEPKAAAK